MRLACSCHPCSAALTMSKVAYVSGDLSLSGTRLLLKRQQTLASARTEISRRACLRGALSAATFPPINLAPGKVRRRFRTSRHASVLLVQAALKRFTGPFRARQSICYLRRAHRLHLEPGLVGAPADQLLSVRACTGTTPSLALRLKNDVFLTGLQMH